jgi:aminoglycoside phosphotransferase (APT) family kinase protein
VSSEDPFLVGLSAWLADRLGADSVGLEGVARHTEGFSWRTYTLDAVWSTAGGEPRRRGLAFRVEPEDGLLPPYDVVAQYELQKALAGTGLPVPEPLWLEADPAPVGPRFFAMERIEGRVPVPWGAREAEIFPTETARIEFGRRFADLQARIHDLDWRRLGLGYLAADLDPEVSARAQLDRWVGLYESSRLVEVPIIRAAIIWLERNLRPSGDMVLCHGDYRIGNVMEREGELVAVFDWELAHVGDPIEDLAYTGLRLWRGSDPRICRLLDPAEYFRRYEAVTGTSVEPEQYRAWSIFGLLKAAAVHLRGARAYEEGRTDDLRLAALGHQLQHLTRALIPLLDRGRDRAELA